MSRIYAKFCQHLFFVIFCSFIFMSCNTFTKTTQENVSTRDATQDTTPSTLTNTIESSPPEAFVDCTNEENLPNKGSPSNLDMRSSRVAVDEPYLYLAVEHYIAQFDISDPKMPSILGFWHFPDLQEISNLTIHEGIAYVTSDFTLSLLNLAPQCKFSTITSLNMPFQIAHLETEDNMLYAGGYSKDQSQLQITILSTEEPSEPKELNTVILEPAIWSVHEQIIYSFSMDKIFITDTSNPKMPDTQLASAFTDPAILSSHYARLVNDKLYLLSDMHGLVIVSNLSDASPIINQNPEPYILVGIIKPQGNYVILGYVGCEGNETDCSSNAHILDANNAEEVLTLSFYPHGDIYNYQEIQEDIIYAFSNEELLIADLANPEHAQIINIVSLVP